MQASEALRISRCLSDFYFGCNLRPSVYIVNRFYSKFTRTVLPMSSICGRLSFTARQHYCPMRLTIKLLPLPKLIEGPYPSCQSYYNARKPPPALWRRYQARLCKLGVGVGTSCQNNQRFLISAGRAYARLRVGCGYRKVEEACIPFGMAVCYSISMGLHAEATEFQ